MLSTATLTFYSLSDVHNAPRLNILPRLDDFVRSDDGTGVNSGDSGDLDGSDGSVRNCDVTGLDVVLEVGGDNESFNLALDLTQLRPDTLLCPYPGLSVDLCPHYDLLGHGSLCSGHVLLPGVDLCPGHSYKLSVDSGLELCVHLRPGDHNLLGGHSLDLSADNSTDVSAGNEHCLCGKLASLDHSPGDELGLNSGLAGNSSDHSAGNDTVLEVC